MNRFGFFGHKREDTEDERPDGAVSEAARDESIAEQEPEEFSEEASLPEEEPEKAPEGEGSEEILPDDRKTVVFRTVPSTADTTRFEMPEEGLSDMEEPRELTEDERRDQELRDAERETQAMLELNDDYGFVDVPRRRKAHKKKHPFLRALAVVAALVAIFAFLSSPVFNIRDTAVEGNEYYSVDEVAAMANVAIGKNIFFYANKAEIRSRLLNDPYFKDVKISRKLPSTIRITVTERPQVAEIQYGGKYVIIDDQGIVLRTTDVDPKLTLLTGLTMTKIRPGEKIQAEEKKTLKLLLEMIASMKKGDFYFSEITISGSSVTAKITERLIVKGQAKLLKRVVDNGDLQKVVNKLLMSGTRRGTITISSDSYMSFYPGIL